MAEENSTKGIINFHNALWPLIAAAIVAAITWFVHWMAADASPTRKAVLIGLIAAGVLALSFVAKEGLAWLKNRITDRQLPFAKGDRLSIVVARLAKDDGERTHRVVLSLREQFGDRVEVIAVEKSVTLGKRGNHDDRVLEAQKQGRALVARMKADLLIWGGAIRDEKVVDLNFLGKDGASGDAQSYALNETLRLPEDFGSDLGAVIVAFATSKAAMAVSDDGKYVVPILRPVAEQLAPLIANPPARLNGETKAQLFFAYALIKKTIGDQSGDNHALLQAIMAFREVLTAQIREDAPALWAATQNSLGNALQALAKYEDGGMMQEEAITAYNCALEVHTREQMPLLWAMTKNNLANAYQVQGKRESNIDKLIRALADYEDALEVYTRERTPSQWAMTKTNLGNTLDILGRLERNSARIERAIATYHEALEEINRDRAPLNWAMTQYNLALALDDLGVLNGDSDYIADAITAYRIALGVFEEEGHQPYIDGTRNSLVRAEELLARQRNGGTEG